jgi:hypothetical protein
MKINQPGAHLDHLLRQTRQHHVQLSSMADLKANMLLTVSAVMLSLTVPHIGQPHFRWPGLVLIGFCLLTILLAAYAVMPKTPLGLRRPAPPDIHSHGFNLLFFGDFSRLGYDEFDRAMESILNDPSLAYSAQVKEVYVLGCFLAAKKYRFLRLAYLAFLAGLLASGATLLFTGLTP